MYRRALRIVTASGAGGAGALALVRALRRSLQMGGAERAVVCRRQNECQLQLFGPQRRSGPWRSNRDHLGRRTGRHTDADLRRAANRSLQMCRRACRNLAIGTGDVVSIYMPMTPELAIAMLACARIGAVHSVIFAGFSAESIADRNNDASAKLVITADGLHRRGKVLPLKETVDEALWPSHQRSKNAWCCDGSVKTDVSMTGGTRRLVARCRRQTVGRLARRSARQRSDTVHPVHLRQHRQTKRHSPHDRRLQPVGQANLSVGLRSSRRRHLLVHGRLRLDHRTQLHRLRSAVARAPPA